MGNVGYSLAAAVSWGAGDFSGGQATKKANVLGVVVIVEGVGLLFMLALAVLKAETVPSAPDLVNPVLSCLAGIFDALGNLFFIMATRNGRLDVSSVLSSLYAAVTVVLAFLFLKERVGLWQGAGIAAALVAIVLLAH
jgi:drug/metabolite transporter (DMT)-like permease